MYRYVWLAILLLLLASVAAAQLPDPPSEAALRTLIGRLHAEAAGHSSPATRARLEAQVAAVTGRPERLQNGAGVLLTLRGYPWEGLWFLTGSAQRNLEQPDTLSNMGLLLVLIERHDDAERILLYAVNEWAEFGPAWTNLARLYVDRRDYRRAQHCLDEGNTAQPGSTTREEIALRMAAEQRNPARAANHAVNVANLEPSSAVLRQTLPTIPEADLGRALMARAEAVPLPQTFVELDEPIEGYEDFVLDELNRQYWQAAFWRFSEIGTSTSYQGIPGLTPEAFNQLPPAVRAALQAQGVGPGDPLTALNPTGSRMHYLRLNLHLIRYQKRFQQRLSPIFKDSAVHTIYEQQRDAVKRFSDEYADALEAGADPIAAANRYCRDVINSMNAAHPGYLAAVAEARERSNRLTTRHWNATAGLITLVPAAYQGDEIAFLRRQAAMSGQYYTGALVQWYALGMRAVMLDREMAGAMAEMLHAAAREREREALLVRERLRAEMEAEMEDGEGLGDLIEQWIGLDLGIFAIKIIDGEEIEISGGEGVLGEASYNWEDQEFEIGIGVGVAVPALGPVGGSGKVLGALRIGGSEELALGIHGVLQGSSGTPVGGVDLNVMDDYLWITNAGHPEQSILGSPWRSP